MADAVVGITCITKKNRNTNNTCTCIYYQMFLMYDMCIAPVRNTLPYTHSFVFHILCQDTLGFLQPAAFTAKKLLQT